MKFLPITCANVHVPLGRSGLILDLGRSVVLSLLHALVNREWCDEIKLSDQLLPRQAFLLESFYIYMYIYICIHI